MNATCIAGGIHCLIQVAALVAVTACVNTTGFDLFLDIPVVNPK